MVTAGHGKNHVGPLVWRAELRLPGAYVRILRAWCSTSEREVQDHWGNRRHTCRRKTRPPIQPTCAYCKTFTMVSFLLFFFASCLWNES